MVGGLFRFFFFVCLGGGWKLVTSWGTKRSWWPTQTETGLRRGKTSLHFKQSVRRQVNKLPRLLSKKTTTNYLNSVPHHRILLYMQTSTPKCCRPNQCISPFEPPTPAANLLRKRCEPQPHPRFHNTTQHNTSTAHAAKPKPNHPRHKTTQNKNKTKQKLNTSSHPSHTPSPHQAAPRAQAATVSPATPVPRDQPGPSAAPPASAPPS